MRPQRFLLDCRRVPTHLHNSSNSQRDHAHPPSVARKPLNRRQLRSKGTDRVLRCTSRLIVCLTRCSSRSAQKEEDSREKQERDREGEEVGRRGVGKVVGWVQRRGDDVLLLGFHVGQDGVRCVEVEDEVRLSRRRANELAEESEQMSTDKSPSVSMVEEEASRQTCGFLLHPSTTHPHPHTPAHPPCPTHRPFPFAGSAPGLASPRLACHVASASTSPTSRRACKMQQTHSLQECVGAMALGPRWAGAKNRLVPVPWQEGYRRAA